MGVLGGPGSRAGGVRKWSDYYYLWSLDGRMALLFIHLPINLTLASVLGLVVVRGTERVGAYCININITFITHTQNAMHDACTTVCNSYPFRSDRITNLFTSTVSMKKQEYHPPLAPNPRKRQQSAN